MWDTKSCFTGQTSAWCGGAGPFSKVDTITSGNTGEFRRNDLGLNRGPSLSSLAPEGPTRSVTPSPGNELMAVQSLQSFGQAEVGQWLHDAYERLGTQLNRLMARNSKLSYKITTAQLLDMKHKQLSETRSTLEQEKEALELSQLEKSQHLGELNERVLKLENDLLQIRSTFEGESTDLLTERGPGSFGRTLQEDFNRQEGQNTDTEVFKLKEALRNALHKLQTSKEIQSSLWNQIEALNQRIKQERKNQSELQEELSEANNKISQACLEKAVLSTVVSKLEDSLKELEAKLTGPHKDLLIQEKADPHLLERHLKREQQGSLGCYITVQPEGRSETIREENEKLTCELEILKQKLITSQSKIHDLSTERVISSKKISDLETECSQLNRGKEELRKMNEVRVEQLTSVNEKCCHLRKCMEVLELEKKKLESQCLGKEGTLHLLREEYQSLDGERAQSSEELRAEAKHWTERLQNVAFTLQSTQEELEEVKKTKSRDDIESLLKAELDSRKQELQLERSKTQALLHGRKDGGASDSVHTRGKETATDLSQSSSCGRLSVSNCSQNKPNQASEKYQNDGRQVNSSIIDSLRAQLEGTSRRTNQLKQEKTLLQPLRRLYLLKDESTSVEEREDKTVYPVNPVTEQQRRTVTELMSTISAVINSLTAENVNLLRGYPLTAKKEKCPIAEVPIRADCLNEDDPQQTWLPSPYPDGIFLAEPVDIRSPDED